MSRKPMPGITKETFASLDDLKTDIHKAEIRVKGKSKTNITYFVSLATHKRLKQHALDNNTTLQQILDEAVDAYFAAHGLEPIERISHSQKEPSK